MEFESIQKEWTARRRDLQTWWGELERLHEKLGKRTDHGARWARPQLEQEADRVRAQLAQGDARFAGIEEAHAAYGATAADVQRTAVSLDAPDEAQLAYIRAQRAAVAAWAVFIEAATGWAMPSLGSSALRRGYSRAHYGINGQTNTAETAAKAIDLASYVPGDRNSSTAATAHDVASNAGLIEPAQMVFEVAAESEHTDARLAFDVRWMRFANNNDLPFEGVKYPALPSANELAHAQSAGARGT